MEHTYSSLVPGKMPRVRIPKINDEQELSGGGKSIGWADDVPRRTTSERRLFKTDGRRRFEEDDDDDRCSLRWGGAEHEEVVWLPCSVSIKLTGNVSQD